MPVFTWEAKTRVGEIKRGEMEAENAEAVTIDEILENGWISTSFQSLVSIKRRSLLGVEALARCAVRPRRGPVTGSCNVPRTGPN